jgi:hypothetical protein
MAVSMKNAVSGIWYRVGIVCTDVSEERIASIFRVEKSTSEDPIGYEVGWTPEPV